MFKFKTKMTESISTSQTKSIPYHKLLDELFPPQDDDNKDSTTLLEKVGTLAIEAFIEELEDEKKATCKYLSLSGSPFSFDHFQMM